LPRLRADHGPAVLAFELANRTYFARVVADRGREFFDRFTEDFDALLVDQEAGTCIFHVPIGEDGAVLGRFNLVDLADTTAELGYRVAEHAAGRGMAAATVRELCRRVGTGCGLTRPASSDNPRQRGLPEGPDQGRVRPDRPGRARRPARHLVPA